MELSLSERESLLRYASQIAVDRGDEEKVLEHARFLEAWVQQSSCACALEDSEQCAEKSARMKALSRAYANNTVEGHGNPGWFVGPAEVYYGFLIDS